MQEKVWLIVEDEKDYLFLVSMDESLSYVPYEDLRGRSVLIDPIEREIIGFDEDLGETDVPAQHKIPKAGPQVYLPYTDYGRSASVLSFDHLLQQRVDILKILTCLLNPKARYDIPAVNMWKGYERDLLNYQREICSEWARRGYECAILQETERLFARHRSLRDRSIVPWWMGNRAFHRGNQSSLLRKDHFRYSEYFRDVPMNLPYIWPGRFESDLPHHMPAKLKRTIDEVNDDTVPWGTD